MASKPMVSVNLDEVATTVVGMIPTRSDMKKAIKALGAAARAEWIALAHDELNTTGRDYIQGIGEPQVRENGVSITLSGALPHMVEKGWPRTDLRKTVLTSPHAKTAKAGHKYLAIPFRHGAPGTSGKVGRVMPKPIHNVARHLSPTLSGPTRSGTRPMKFGGDRLHAGMKMSGKARHLLESKEKNWHSSSIYAGMIRKVATYSSGPNGEPVTQNTYQTFRTISEAVSNGPRHWIHPGIKARNLIPKVQKLVVKVAAKVISDAAK